MFHFTFSKSGPLFIILACILLASCQQTQTLVLSTPSAEGLSQNILEFEQDSYQVEAHFPIGYPVPKEGIKVHFTRGMNNGESYLSAGLDRNSLFIIRNMNVVSDGSPALKIILFLQVNHLKLPAYQSPSLPQFEISDIFDGVGEIFLAGISFNHSLVRPEGQCNAALVGPNLVLTANHCIEDQADCERASFLIWTFEDSKSENRALFGSYACERLLIAKPEHDQSLISLKEKVSPQLNAHSLNLETTDWYFPDETPVVMVSDFTRWEMKVDKKAKKTFSNSSQAEKKSFVARVERSSFGYSASDGGNPDPLAGKLTRVLNFYDLSLEPQPGQSGSPVLNLDGNIIGVMNTNTGYMTPIEPDIKSLVNQLNQSNQR